MNATEADARAARLATVLGLWTIAALVGMRVAPDIHHAHYRPGPRPQGESLLHRVFGTTRTALSQAMMVEADRYFHRGVAHERPHAGGGLFSGWADAISPRVPDQIQGGEIEEIMPWLRFATLSDPANVDAYLTTAFWLSRQDQPARALYVLDEAERHNPHDYRVYMGRGFHYFESFLTESALANFEKAMNLWPGGLSDTDPQARLDRGQMLTFSGALHELQGNYAQAVAYYEEVRNLFPQRTWLEERIDQLRRGNTDLSDEFWKNVLQSAGILGNQASMEFDGHSHTATNHAAGYCPSCRTVH